jgi:penicillin-binding protein 2
VALYNSNNTLKDHFRETRLFTTRAVFALILTVMLMLVLLVRLVNLQILEHESYKVLSDRNRIHIRPITPTRGLIYDRNGVLLAQNLPSFSLDIVPEQIKNMDNTIKELAKLVTISEDDITTFKARLKKNSRRHKPVSLRSRLSDEEVARFAVNRHRFTGVDTVARLYRHYPQGSLGVHALGYVGRINERELQRIDPTNYEGTN